MAVASATERTSSLKDSFKQTPKHFIKQIPVRNLVSGGVGVSAIGWLATLLANKALLTAPVGKPLNNLEITLGRLSPLFDIPFFALNTVAAALNGYSWRTLMMGLITLTNILTFKLRNQAAELAEAKNDFEIKLENISESPLKKQLQRAYVFVSQKFESLHNQVSFIDKVLMVLFFGGLAMQKGSRTVASAPWGKEHVFVHTQGERLGEIYKNGKVFQTFKQNLSSEWQAFMSALKNFPQGISNSLTSVKSGVSSGSVKGFESSLVNSSLPLLLYAGVTLFRAGSALGYAGLAAANGIDDTFNHHKSQNNSFNIPEALLGLSGIIAAPAAALTVYPNWFALPMTLYRIAAVPYGLGSVAALFPNLIPGLDSRSSVFLTKLGLGLQMVTMAFKTKAKAH